MSIHGHRVFTDWLEGVLTAGGLNTGRSHAPASIDWTKGYIVVWPIAGGVTSGTIDDPRSVAEPDIQVSSVSRSEEQSLWLADRTRSLIDAAVPAPLPDGRAVFWLDFPMASLTVRRDDDVQPPIYTAIDRFSFGTTS